MSKVKVDSIDPVNPVVPVAFGGPSVPTFLGVPLNFPVKPDGTTQSTVGVYAGSGAPNAGLGSNGSIYIREDGNTMTTIYHRRAGTWVGIL